MHHISLVFQNYNLIDYLSPLENIRLVNKKAKQGYPSWTWFRWKSNQEKCSPIIRWAATTCSHCSSINDETASVVVWWTNCSTGSWDYSSSSLISLKNFNKQVLLKWLWPTKWMWHKKWRQRSFIWNKVRLLKWAVQIALIIQKPNNLNNIFHTQNKETQHEKNYF